MERFKAQNLIEKMATCTCINLAYNGITTCLPANTQYNTHLDKIHNKEISKNYRNMEEHVEGSTTTKTRTPINKTY